MGLRQMLPVHMKRICFMPAAWFGRCDCDMPWMRFSLRAVPSLDNCDPLEQFKSASKDEVVFRRPRGGVCGSDLVLRSLIILSLIHI